MRTLRKLSFIFCCCLLLAGCRSNQTSLRLVTKISVTDQTGLTRHYTQPQHMETILYYLRSLDALGKPNTDPERISGEHYHIRLEYADGQTSIYRQRANRFLSRDSHPWQKIPSQRASLLGPILKSMDQDWAVTNA